MIHDCFSKIAKNPYLFPEVSNIKSNYHKCVCGVDSIYYKIVENGIVINTIVGRQDFRQSANIVLTLFTLHYKVFSS